MNPPTPTPEPQSPNILNLQVALSKNVNMETMTARVKLENAETVKGRIAIPVP
jgi:hypothetical protein